MRAAGVSLQCAARKRSAGPPRPVRDAFAAAGLMYDAMATGHAVAPYNLLLEERRRVAAALIAVDFGR